THIDDLGVDHWQPDTVGELVDQNEITHLQSGLHGTGRNLERLQQKGAQHQNNGQHRKERLTVLNQQRFLVQSLQNLLVRRADLFFIGRDGQATARRQQEEIKQRQGAADRNGNDQNQREVE